MRAGGSCRSFYSRSGPNLDSRLFAGRRGPDGVLMTIRSPGILHTDMTRHNPDPHLWLRYLRRHPLADLQLFCFPFAGGSASIFRKWDTKLPGNIEVCAIQLPGREDRLWEAPFRQIVPLVNALSEVVAIDLEKSFVFFGHSMGALLAFELSRHLRRLGARQPDHLFVSGFRAPHLPDRQAPTHDLPETSFLEELRRLGGTPDEVLQSSELMTVFTPTLRADFALTETYSYVHEVPLECPISAFVGSDDQEVSYDEIAAWRQHTTGSFSLQSIPGNHFFLLREGQAQLLSVMSDQLDQLIGTRKSAAR